MDFWYVIPDVRGKPLSELRLHDEMKRLCAGDLQVMTAQLAALSKFLSVELGETETGAGAASALA